MTFLQQVPLQQMVDYSKPPGERSHIMDQILMVMQCCCLQLTASALCRRRSS